MSLLQSNATVSTTALDRATNQTVAKLTGVPAYIDAPEAKDQQQAGGIVRFVVLFDPAADVSPGDSLTIQSWGQNAVNPARAYHIFAADPDGGLGLEVLVCLVGERVQR